MLRFAINAIHATVFAYIFASFCYILATPTYPMRLFHDGLAKTIESRENGNTIESQCSKAHDDVALAQACTEFWLSAIELYNDDIWREGYLNALRYDTGENSEIELLPWSYFNRKHIAYAHEKYMLHTEGKRNRYLNLINHKHDKK